jgi:hypothetical protein
MQKYASSFASGDLQFGHTSSALPEAVVGPTNWTNPLTTDADNRQDDR